jgi:hypothetical protein
MSPRAGARSPRRWRNALGVSCVADRPAVVVIGASGYAGAIAADLLWRHPQFELVAITAREDAGRPLNELYPRHRVPLALEDLDLDRAAQADAAIVAYPHGTAAPVVAALLSRGLRVVDLSADFRLRDVAQYEQWYVPHPPGADRQRRLRADRALPRADRRRHARGLPGLLPDRRDPRARAARAARADRRRRD